MKEVFTKCVLIILGFMLFSSADVKAQNGLQNVIVERYYLSDNNDAAGSIGTLPAHSITYRIFLDMKQGYKFQTAYGSPTHTLFIKTTTSFFNNEDRGSTTPTFTKNQARNNTVMLDSWLSAGAACAGNFGILKSEDNGVANAVNLDGLLANNDPMAGIPLTVQDGFIAGAPGSFTAIGIDNDIVVFDAISQAGNSFLTTNGAWSCLNGAIGPDTTNKVLIAQITTEGEMSFELNIQIGTPTGGAEQYVAKNPVGNEIKLDCLTFNSSINTGVKEPVRNDNEVSVFPNPTVGQTTLEIHSENKNLNIHYAVYDLLGHELIKKNVQSTSGNYSEKIDLARLPEGIYFVATTVNGSKTVHKVILN